MGIINRFCRTRKNKHLRLRLENCVNTIMELNDRLGEGKIRPEIIEHFENLKESLQNVTDDSVDERDINRIEHATNQLLDEIKTTFDEEMVSFLYEGRPH